MQGGILPEETSRMQGQPQKSMLVSLAATRSFCEKFFTTIQTHALSIFDAGNKEGQGSSY